MELRQLKTFMTVARFLNFNRAAQALNYAQSTISTQIRLLEEEFGKPLFDRLGKTIVLTEAGQVLLRYAGKMLDIERETMAQVARHDETQGSLTLRVPQSLSVYLLPPVIKAFRARYPRVGLDISNCAQTIQQELRSGIIDLAFLLADSIVEQDLIAELLGYEELLLAAGPDHPLAAHSALEMAHLADHTVLLPKQDCSYKLLFERLLAEEKVGCASIMEFNSVEAIKQCVQQGVGVTLIPAMAVRQELTAGTLVRLPWSEDPLETAVLMIRHRDKWISPVLGAFMELVRTHCAGIKPSSSNPRKNKKEVRK